MVDSYTATYVIAGFLIIFGVLLPILDKIPKVKSVVSLRWTIVIIYSALCVGVIINFSHLDTCVRFAVVIGGIILSALFMIVRSLEKAAINKWELPHARTSIKHGDIQAELSVSPKTIREIVQEVDDNSKSEAYKKHRKKDLDELMNQSLNNDILNSSDFSTILTTSDKKKKEIGL